MKKILWIIFLSLMLNGQSAMAQDTLLLRLPYEKGALVTATFPNGEIVELGTVRALPTKTNWPAYTASKWGTPSTVCATAVNAIHILVDVEKERGRIISVVPKVTVAPAAPEGAFFSVDTPAGTGLFGAFAPYTGSKAFIEKADGQRLPLTRLPEAGETLLLETALSERSGTWMVDIENRPGGRVLAWTDAGPEVVARVIRPLGGVGRFGGTEYQTIGRIRASHTGVIDVATSKRGKVGGFQIMPLMHALTSPEMINAWKMTQWMIIGPLPGKEPLEGTSPLFKGTLVPGTQLNDKLDDVWSTYGRKPLILARINGREWVHLPDISGKADGALSELTHLRIYYPYWDDDLSDR